MAAMDGRRGGEGFVKCAVLLLLLAFLGASTALRPLRERASTATGSWNDEVYLLLLLFIMKNYIMFFLAVSSAEFFKCVL